MEKDYSIRFVGSIKKFPREGNDVVDYPPNDYIFRKRDTLFLIGGIGTYIADLVLDFLAAYNHWSHKNYSWFYMTVAFIATPSLIITVLSLWWYIQDTINNSRPKIKLNCCFLQWCLRLCLLTFQLAPVMRYLECLYYGLLSRKAWQREDIITQKQLYTLMLFEDADCVLLRLIENFSEAVPQLMLQLYILLQYPTSISDPLWVKLLWCSCLSSLLSVSWGVTAYFRDSRFTDVKKNNVSLKGTVVILLWQFCSIGSRVLALVIFSSLVKLWILAVCFGHWLLMLLWLLGQRSFKHISNCGYELLLSSVFAVVYVFAFINDKDEPTRVKYAAFYCIFGLEHLVMMVIWLVFGDTNSWYYFKGVIAHYVSFLTALILMVVYYDKFHPTLPHIGTTNVERPCSPSSVSSHKNGIRSVSPSNLTRNPALQLQHIISEDSEKNSLSDNVTIIERTEGSHPALNCSSQDVKAVSAVSLYDNISAKNSSLPSHEKRSSFSSSTDSYCEFTNASSQSNIATNEATKQESVSSRKVEVEI